MLNDVVHGVFDESAVSRTNLANSMTDPGVKAQIAERMED
jgi:hypothetical protein